MFWNIYILCRSIRKIWPDSAHTCYVQITSANFSKSNLWSTSLNTVTEFILDRIDPLFYYPEFQTIICKTASLILLSFLMKLILLIFSKYNNVLIHNFFNNFRNYEQFTNRPVINDLKSIMYSNCFNKL